VGIGRSATEFAFSPACYTFHRGHENEFATVAGLSAGDRCDLSQWRQKDYKKKKDLEGEKVRKALDEL
jgi:hypothetical protein